MIYSIVGGPIWNVVQQVGLQNAIYMPLFNAAGDRIYGVITDFNKYYFFKAYRTTGLAELTV
jgi:hypothetical protein